MVFDDELDTKGGNKNSEDGKCVTLPVDAMMDTK